MEYEQHMSLFDNLPALENLFIDSSHIADEWYFARGDGVELPSLINMHVYAGRRVSFNSLFGALYMPSLQELTIESLNEVALDRMLTFLETERGDAPQFPILQNLTISVAPVDQIGASLFAKLGQHCPNVSQLNMSNEFWNGKNSWDTFLLSLDSPPTADSTFPWPALETLSLDHIGLNRTLLRTVIENRSMARRPLKTLQMAAAGMQVVDANFEQVREYVDVRVFDPWEILSAHTRNWGNEF